MALKIITEIQDPKEKRKKAKAKQMEEVIAALKSLNQRCQVLHDGLEEWVQEAISARDGTD